MYFSAGGGCIRLITSMHFVAILNGLLPIEIFKTRIMLNSNDCNGK